MSDDKENWSCFIVIPARGTASPLPLVVLAVVVVVMTIVLVVDVAVMLVVMVMVVMTEIVVAVVLVVLVLDVVVPVVVVTVVLMVAVMLVVVVTVVLVVMLAPVLVVVVVLVIVVTALHHLSGFLELTPAEDVGLLELEVVLGLTAGSDGGVLGRGGSDLADGHEKAEEGGGKLHGGWWCVKESGCLCVYALGPKIKRSVLC